MGRPGKKIKGGRASRCVSFRPKRGAYCVGRPRCHYIYANTPTHRGAARPTATSLSTFRRCVLSFICVETAVVVGSGCARGVCCKRDVHVW